MRARGAQPTLMLADSILRHAVLGLGSLSDGAAYFGRCGEEFRQRPRAHPNRVALRSGIQAC
jgi:hypothetical protein